MNVSDMKASVLLKCNLPSADYTLFPEADMLSLFNEAQKEIIRITSCLEGIYTLNTTAGTSTYTFDTDFIYIKRLGYNGKIITQLTERDLDLIDDDWQARTGEPTNFVFYSPKTILLYPIPTEVKQLKATCVIIPTALVNNSDTPEIPSMWHSIIVDYAVMIWKIARMEMAPNERAIWEDRVSSAIGNITPQRNRTLKVRTVFNVDNYRPSY